MQDVPSLCSEQKELKIFPERTNITSYQSENLNENNVNHTEEVIIRLEQGTIFPTKIGTTICNALIDTGATRSCMSEKLLQEITVGQNSFITKCQCKVSHW